MALSLCRTTVDDSARELMEHGTAAFPIGPYSQDEVLFFFQVV